MSSAVCSAALHSQFGEEARLHLCMDEWNCPTPVLKQLLAAWDKLIPTGLAPVMGTKTRSLEELSQYSTFHLWFVHLEAWMPSPARLSKRFCTANTNGHLDLSLSWQASEESL